MKNDFLSQHINKILGGLALVAISSAIVVYWTYRSVFPGKFSSTHGHWGEFGDFIGGILNPWFALLAFFALLLTIILQSPELSISSKELSKSAAALAAQNRAIQLQNFENTFFKMVNLHGDIVANLTFEPNFSSRRCFTKFIDRFSAHSDRVLANEVFVDQEKLIEETYKSFNQETQSSLGHYFLNMYLIVKFVDQSQAQNKKQYTDILRAQLNTYELGILFYHCLCGVEKQRFKPLIEKYELLENIDIATLRSPPDHLPLYKDEAYGESKIR